MKTTKKLFFFLILICFFVFACSTTIIKAVYKEVLFDNTYNTAIGSLRQIEFNMNGKREQISKTMLQIVAGKSLKELACVKNAASIYSYEEINNFNKEILEVLNYSEDIASIVYINQDGYMVGTDGETVWREAVGIELDEKLKQVLLNRQKRTKNIHFFTGGFDSGLFYGNKQYLQKGKEDYITAVVPCEFSQNPKIEGTLIVNAKEKAFRNIFSATMEEDSGEVYILDDRGKILSSTRSDLIQSGYLLMDEISLSEKEHYFTAGNIYAISYQMPETDWGIVWERPIGSFYREADQLYGILMIFVLISLVLIFTFYGFYIKILLKPLQTLTKAMKNVGKGQYGIMIEESTKEKHFYTSLFGSYGSQAHNMQVGKCEGEIGKVIHSFNEMSKDIENLTKENLRVNNEKRTLQLLALQEQMSPHFVLNALNTIKWMATIAKEKNIVNMVISLSKVIHVFKNTSAFCTIGEEIDFVKNYIIVMNYRYGDVITVDYEVENKLLPVSIPIFFIQPFVENSLKHGFESTNCQGIIRIKVWEEKNNILIQVSDNGSGMEKTRQEELNQKFEQAGQAAFHEMGGVGLMNIAKRIQIYYGCGYGIYIENTEETGAQFLLTLPNEYEEKSGRTK